MTPENQPENGIAKKAYGIIKAGGHSFKRATLGDIYTLIDERSNEAREHREENFRYLNTRIDSQVGEVRQELGKVTQRIDTLADRMDNRIDILSQKIDDQIGKVNQRIDTLGQKMDDQIGKVNQRLDSIMQILIDLSKQKI